MLAHRSLTKQIIFLLILSLILPACGAEEIPPTPTASPTTIAATPTSEPTTAPSPTPTDTPIETPEEPPVTVLLFTGIIVPGRCVQAAIDERGDYDFPYEEVREIILGADIAVGTLNAAISDFPPHTGCVPTFVLVGGSENADALARAGFDVMSVATNHIKNCGITTCGDRAFLDTLNNLQRVGIEPVGAGLNLAEASQPVVIEANGIRFGILSLGQIEESAFAGEDIPGIGVLTEESLVAGIQATSEIADVVIAMPHWGPEYSANPNWSQLELGRAAVDAGADLVVGNHTHVIQGFHELDGIPVFYGLGNFIFDQDWERQQQQSLILLVRFRGTELLDYQVIATIVEGDGTVHLASEEETSEIMARLEIVNANIPTLPSD